MADETIDAGHGNTDDWQSLCPSCGATLSGEPEACPDCDAEVIPVDRLLRQASVLQHPETIKLGRHQIIAYSIDIASIQIAKIIVMLLPVVVLYVGKQLDSEFLYDRKIQLVLMGCTVLSAVGVVALIWIEKRLERVHKADGMRK